MDHEHNAISEMRVITISREYGSGGGEIAARLAHHLGWQLIDIVIIGRGSQVLLAQRRDVFHVRIVAPLEQRIAYVMRREGLDRAAAQSHIQLKDRDRVRYLQKHYREHPADAHLYDIMVNTSMLDLESAVDVLVFALERQAQRLSTPTGELGPATGLAR
jgi:CMP/dCMP kinase